MECVLERKEESYGLRILGRILNVKVKGDILDDKGRIDASKIKAFAFDQTRKDYQEIGNKAGTAWHSGTPYLKE